MELSLHREQSTAALELKVNGTSPYFDLSPLYGTNKEETNKVRMKDGSGRLWPDCFSEDRLTMLPDSVPALLILWNRYHNYVANRLLSYNERNKWHDPLNLDLDKCLAQDDEIFDIAQTITCIHFMNVVKEDFLRGLLGLAFTGPSAQLDILYDVKGKTNAKNGYPSTIESFFLYNFLSLAPPSFTPITQEQATGRMTFGDPDVRRRNYIGLSRNKRGYFEDSDLAEKILDATEVRAGMPGCATIPKWAREHEIRRIEQARIANVCTLNDFRKHIGLKPLNSFDEWNPTLAKAASDLYKNDIQKLELYPGLMGETPFNGSSFCFGYTMTWGLIADIVIRIRSDSRFMAKFNEYELTKWGYKDCLESIDNVGGSFNAMLPKVLQRTLPRNYSYDNVYCLFPFNTPEKNKEGLEMLSDSEKRKYGFERPKQTKIKILRTISAISEVLNDTNRFPTPYKRNLIELTGGYGHMLGFDDLALHDRDLMLTLFSLMPDKGAVKRIGASFAQKARDNLVQRSNISKDKATIDVVKDLIDATCTRWVCETIYNLHFEDDDLRGLSKIKIDEAYQKSRKRELKERENFAYYYAYIFRNNEPEFGWNIREKALAASQNLRQHLKDNLPRDTEPSDARFFVYTLKLWTYAYNFVARIIEEYSDKGKKLSQHSAHTFLDRMVKAATIRPLKHLADHSSHLLKLKETLEDDAKEEAKVNGGRTLFERMRKEGIVSALIHFVGNAHPSDVEIEHVARQKLEEQRVLANVIGLAAVVSVYFSKVCAQAVDFYLDDKYAKEREELVKLCRNGKSNEEIMAYIREAQRIGQHFGLWRDVAVPEAEARITIKQSHGYPDVVIEAGDRIYADFTWAHNDPKQFPDPNTVKTDRKVNSLMGLGVHKCPAGSFLEQTMPEVSISCHTIK
ncbi:hypothetical protein AX15_003144 [Amanita polypyramis BW_CC]|nr:hypothetical protein AX15_003144 [Amanita polypyramis BW_CC]